MAADYQTHPSGITDDERSSVAPPLTSLSTGTPKRMHDLRGPFNCPSLAVHGGVAEWTMPHDLLT